MARGRFIAALAVSADDSPETDGRDPLPTLEERATFYLRAIHGDRRFTSEEYSNARDLILQAMADDIAARSSGRSQDHVPLPLGVQHDGLTAIADTPSFPGAEPRARDSKEAAAVVARKLRTLSRRLPSSLRLPSFPALPRMAAVCAAAAAAAVVGYWVGGITAQFAPNTAHNSSLTAQVAPPDSASGSPSGSNPRIVAEAERELASALNSAQLRPDEIAALVKSGQELIAEGKFRFARLVLERAAEAKSAAAALALARTYDPLVDRPAGRGDAPPDVAMARAWYERAKELGSTEAAQRLNQSPASAATPPSRPGPK
jgi:hypothetical protein